MIDFRLQRHAFYTLLAAGLFGASAPVAKLLLNNISPLALAGLLYLGSGIGLFLVCTVKKYLSAGEPHTEAALHGSDYVWLTGAVIAGGITAPVLLLWGLDKIAASNASLLLNFEGIFTTLMAVLLFGEAVGRRIWLASIAMLAAGFLLAWNLRLPWEFSPGMAALLGACFMWAVDNNLTRKISATDPLTIATIKGLTAGGFNMILAYSVGEKIPGGKFLLAAMTLGFLGYGVSLAIFIYALRHLGAARAMTYFSAAPFLGAGISIPLLGEPVSPAFLAAFALALVSAWLALGERHVHAHAHARLVHAHKHFRDPHHRHNHEGGEADEPHSHEHAHEPMTHAHPHFPDIHHRHRH